VGPGHLKLFSFVVNAIDALPYASDLDDFAELHDAGDGGVVAFVGDEGINGGGEGVLHVGDGLEEEVSDGVVGSRSARGKLPSTLSISMRMRPRESRSRWASSRCGPR
jgi:hypothetical protein